MSESGRNGNYRIEDAVERRLAYLEREDAARELCFQRAEETRRRSSSPYGENLEG